MVLCEAARLPVHLHRQHQAGPGQEQGDEGEFEEVPGRGRQAGAVGCVENGEAEVRQGGVGG